MTATVELAPLWDLFGFLAELAAYVLALVLLILAYRSDGRAERDAFRGLWGAANFERLGAISYVLAAGFLLVLLNV